MPIVPSTYGTVSTQLVPERMEAIWLGVEIEMEVMYASMKFLSRYLLLCPHSGPQIDIRLIGIHIGRPKLNRSRTL